MKREVLEFSKLAYKQKLFAGTSGNLSVYDRVSGLVAITPTSISYDSMELDDIVIINMEGEFEKGGRRPSSEWQMHLEIYKRCDDVNAVVHTHSPYATAFAVTHKKIPVILIEMMFFLLGDVRVVKYAPPGSVMLGEEAAQSLKGRRACLLANHGVVAVGADLESAHLAATYVEDGAKIYINAKALGEPKEIEITEQNAIRRKMGIEEERE